MSTLKKLRTVGDLARNTICSLPRTITEEEEKLLNSYPVSEIVPVLQGLVNQPNDRPDYVAIQSRALDALLKLEDFDNLGYLIALYDSSSLEKGYVLIEKFADFNEPRSTDKLCEIAKTSIDPDHRYQAVFSLFLLSNPETLETLEWVAENDEGEDYEGDKVSRMAQKAIQKIRDML